METVLVYRHQLFKPSEPFIQHQALALRSFRPVFVGRYRAGAPIDPAVRALTLRDRPGATGSLQAAFNVLTRDPGCYLSLIRGETPVLIHAHFGVEGLYALGLARKRGIPLLTTFHGFDATVGKRALLRSRKVSWIHYALFRRDLMLGGTLFICVSEFIRRRLLSLGFPEKKTVTHYIGIDREALPVRSEDQQAKIILHVARLVEKKGTAYLLRAFAAIAGMEPEAILVIIGDGQLRGELGVLAGELGIAGRVRFLGQCDHPTTLRWMARAWVFCLPSTTARSGDAEGLGMVLLEAAARGVPVIGTRHGGIPEAVEDGVTGFLVTERSDAEIADRLLILLRSDSTRISMGEAGRRMTAEKFDLQRQTRKLEDLYRSLL